MHIKFTIQEATTNFNFVMFVEPFCKAVLCFELKYSMRQMTASVGLHTGSAVRRTRCMLVHGSCQFVAHVFLHDNMS